MSVTWRRLAVAVAAVAAAATAPATAEVDATVRTGVWWQGNQGGVAVPPPPVLVDVPEGGLWVLSGPEGDLARSAVRFELPGGAVPEELVLRVHADSSLPGSTLVLCAAAGPWEAPDEHPGAWDQRAEPDCGAFVTPGAVDGGQLRFSLAGLASDGSVDVVLTRIPGDSEAVLDVTFEAPAAGDLRTSSRPDAGGTVVQSPTMVPTETGLGFTPGTFASPIFVLPPAAPPDAVSMTTSTTDAPGSRRGPDPSAEVALAVDPVESWDAARWAALAALIGLALWIAAIARHRLAGGAPSTSFTIYRGSPPS